MRENEETERVGGGQCFVGSKCEQNAQYSLRPVSTANVNESLTITN
jgi:hypothetical protein